MNYAEHQRAALDLKPRDVDAQLKSLGRDQRFSAVVAWIERNRDNFVNAGSRQAIADSHGSLAHSQGSVHALNVLAAQLAKLLKPPVRSGEPEPEPES